MGDVVVVGDTAVLGLLLVVGGEQQMGLVVVAEITAVHGVVEERGALVVVVAAAVQIVELETETQPLAGIDGEEGLEVVLTVGAVAARLQREVGDGRVGVGEMVVAHIGDEIVEGLGENKLAIGLPEVEDAALAGNTQVARRVVLTAKTGGEHGVHIEIRHRVDLGRTPVTEKGVYRPYLQTAGYLLVSARRAVAGVARAARHPAAFVYAVKVLGPQPRTAQNKQQNKEDACQIPHFQPFTSQSCVWHTPPSSQPSPPAR